MGGATRLGLLFALVGGAVIFGAQPAAAGTLPPGFHDTVVFSGLTEPTAVRFSTDGRVFVAEKAGVIKVFHALGDSTPTVFADLNVNVHNYWDRGLLGLALDPGFPDNPYVYVLYTYDGPIGGTAPTWGTPGVYWDPCADPLGNGCAASGRLSRLRAAGDVMAGVEQPLISDWCQQFPSHSLGDLAFGSGGALYVSAGEAASFTFEDYGQAGNPCGDPVLEGGALRAQDLRTSDDPAGLDGALLRVNPGSGAAAGGNPLGSNPDPNARRIVAEGLRNPYRFALRPGTKELWIADPGWSTWEEIDRIQDPTLAVHNFGWPCFEGFVRQPEFEHLGVPICQSLYADPQAVTMPYYAYSHATSVVPGDTCPTATSALSALAFYTGTSYPSQYRGALFFGDFSRRCIWAMLPGSNGLPDPNTIVLIDAGADGPVDLEAGPEGDLFYVDYAGGTVHRISYAAPTAVGFRSAQAQPTRRGVLVRWSTGSDFETLGFNVYRGRQGNRVRVNPTLIRSRSFLHREAPQVGNDPYWIERVALDGSTAWYGPVAVR